MKSFISLVFVALVGGCASMPTPEQTASADYGTYPGNSEDLVKAYYSATLKDPDSVKYRQITSPQKYWLGNRFEGNKYGYLVCATLNAKNSYGAYVGYQTDGLLIRNGSIVQFVSKSEWFGRSIC
jgi:hypothetical protein